MTSNLHLPRRLRQSGAVPGLLFAVMTCTRKTFGDSNSKKFTRHCCLLLNTEFVEIKEQGNVHRDFIGKCLGMELLAVPRIHPKHSE